MRVKADADIFPQNAAPQHVSTDLPYEDFGYLPGAAQQAQAAIYPNPHLNPQPYFTLADWHVANWFTTRVHLSPLGKAITNDQRY